MFAISNFCFSRTYSCFFKDNHNCSVQISKSYGQWTKADLPLMAKVAFVHKIMKIALNECEHEIPKDYNEKVRNHLNEIRKINWNLYNMQGTNLYKTQKVKKLLQELNDCEQDLPEPLAKQLKKINLFGSLRDAINYLDERNG